MDDWKQDPRNATRPALKEEINKVLARNCEVSEAELKCLGLCIAYTLYKMHKAVEISEKDFLYGIQMDEIIIQNLGAPSEYLQN